MSNPKLATNTFEILNQLVDLLKQFDKVEYQRPLPILSHNSIGKHVRHILEFYLEMIKGVKTGVIDYDLRNRDLLIETDVEVAIDNIHYINRNIINSTFNSSLQLNVCLSMDKEVVEIATNLNRELAYNIEHAIHHYALIKIAVDHCFEDISLPENFGVAFSTVKHLQAVCAP